MHKPMSASMHSYVHARTHISRHAHPYNQLGLFSQAHVHAINIAIQAAFMSSCILSFRINIHFLYTLYR